MKIFKIIFETIDIASIIKNFALMIKFNTLLMIDCFSKFDRSQFDKILMQNRLNYQQLHEIIVLFFIMNFRNKKIISIFAFSKIEISTIKLKKFINMKIEKYRNVAKRSNLHVELHYFDVLKKYDLINHCNVLINENKHR